MALPAYSLTVEIRRPLTAALEKLRTALAAEGFVVLAELEPPAEGPYRQILYTDPVLQEDMLRAEPDIGAMLPWCACALEIAPGQVHVGLQDPMVIAAYTRNRDIHAACKQAYVSVRRVVDRLMLGDPISF